MFIPRHVSDSEAVKALQAERDQLMDRIDRLNAEIREFMQK